MARYGTIAQLKIRAEITAVLTAAETTMLEEILDASSRAIDRACKTIDDGFAVPTVASTKYFTAYGENFLRIPPCIALTTVSVKASRTAATYTAWSTPTTAMAGDGDWLPARGNAQDPTYATLPYNLLIIDRNGDYATFLNGDDAPVVKILATWGSQSVTPADIREACLMQATKWFKQEQGAMAATLGNYEFGQIKYRRGLDREVLSILINGGWIPPLYGGE